MKKVFLLALLLPLISMSQNQFSNDFHLYAGSSYDALDYYGSKYFTFENEILIVKWAKKDIWIQKYNEENKKIAYTKTYVDFHKDKSIEEIISFKNSIFLIYSIWEKQSKQTVLYAQEINIVTGNLSKEHKILSVNKKKEFNFYTSDNSDRLLIQYRNSPLYKDDKINYDLIGMYVFGSDMGLIWGRDVKMPYTEHMMDVFNYYVDGKSNVYVLSKLFNTEIQKDLLPDTINFHFELLVYNGNRESILRLPSSEDVYVDLNLKESEDGKLHLFCFYSKAETFKEVEGLAYAEINLESSMLELVTYKIPIDYSTTYKFDSNLKSDQKDSEPPFNFFSIEQIEVLDDGSFVVVSEKNYVITVYDSKGNERSRHYFEDNLICKTSSDQGLIWVSRLPKRLRSHEECSTKTFKFVTNENYYYLFYIDHKDNNKLKYGEEPKYHWYGALGMLIAYEINDSDGEFERKPIVNLKNIRLANFEKSLSGSAYLVNRILETQTGVIFKSSYGRKEDVMIHVDFE